MIKILLTILLILSFGVCFADNERHLIQKLKDSAQDAGRLNPEDKYPGNPIYGQFRADFFELVYSPDLTKDGVKSIFKLWDQSPATFGPYISAFTFPQVEGKNPPYRAKPELKKWIEHEIELRFTSFIDEDGINWMANLARQIDWTRNISISNLILSEINDQDKESQDRSLRDLLLILYYRAEAIAKATRRDGRDVVRDLWQELEQKNARLYSRLLYRKVYLDLEIKYDHYIQTGLGAAMLEEQIAKVLSTAQDAGTKEFALSKFSNYLIARRGREDTARDIKNLAKTLGFAEKRGNQKPAAEPVMVFDGKLLELVKRTIREFPGDILATKIEFRLIGTKARGDTKSVDCPTVLH